MCSDEFSISRGLTGITLETGGQGFYADQIALGVQTAEQAFYYIDCKENKKQFIRNEIPKKSKLYTWARSSIP